MCLSFDTPPFEYTGAVRICIIDICIGCAIYFIVEIGVYCQKNKHFI